MAEKSGVFNGISIGYQGTTKKGQPYTIYNVELLFPSGKSFKLSVPSWSDVYENIKPLKVGTAIKCEVDSKNNIADFKVVAPVSSDNPFDEPTQPPEKQPTQIPDREPDRNDEPEPKSSPVPVYEYTEADRRFQAAELAVDLYKNMNIEGLKIDELGTVSLLVELVMDTTKRIFEFINGSDDTNGYRSDDDGPDTMADNDGDSF